MRICYKVSGFKWRFVYPRAAQEPKSTNVTGQGNNNERRQHETDTYARYFAHDVNDMGL
jgi:hypothetical protein